jgi:DNA-binding CsgD family transcriptional regulator
MTKKILVLFFLIFHTALGYCQIKSIGLPKIENYSKSDYKGGAQNWDIGQNRNGNLFFANTSGLLEYNGTSWLKHNIPGSTVRSVKVDGNNNRIYVGGYNEFGFFEANSNGRLVYRSISKLVNPNSKKIIDFVWKIHILDGAVFFQTFYRTYIYKDKKLTILEAPNRFQFSFVVHNKLYLQDIVLGLVEYRNGKLITLPNTNGLNNTEVWGIIPFGDNSLLVITLDKGLFLYRDKMLTPWPSEANNFVIKNSSLGGRLIDNKYIVLNSVLDGIIICDLNGKIVQHIDKRKGLQNNTALNSFSDANGNLWLGLDNGIAYINENSPFTFLGSSFDLSSVYSSALYNNNLYVATNQGLFSHSWDSSFKGETFNFIAGTTGQAWAIQDIDGSLFCSHNRGLFMVENGKAGAFLDDKKGYLGLKTIPGRPNFLIASNYHGFAIIEKTAAGWKFRNQIEGFNVSDSKFTTDGKNVWLLKNNVYKLKLSDDLKRFTLTTTYENLAKGLKGITSIQQIDNRIYFQSANRFFIYDKNSDRFTEDKSISSLFKNLPEIKYCFEDNKGNICYFYEDSSMGMLMKQRNGSYTNAISPFTPLSGNLVYFFESVNTVDNRNIFIGITEGLVHYDPSLYTESAEPKAFIHSFSFVSDTLVTGNLPEIRKLSIPYNDNNVKFSFSAPIYDNPENIKFSYKLEGFDDKWSNWTSIPVKEYTNLHEGRYRMQVKVVNSYGKESKPAMVSFTISPPIYRHPLAYIFYILLAAAAIYYVRRRVRTKIRQDRYYETLEQRRLYLERETKIRQEQYELEKEIERLRNEQLKVKILTKDKELVNNSLQVVKKNKMLNGIIHKLKDIDSETLDETAKARFTKLYKTIDKELNTDKSWNNLEKHINNVHFDFLKRLKEKYPAITPREMDLSTYLLMNMSTKEIAEIMNISDGGVELARYRLRKKLNLPRKENLTGFLMSI